MLTTRLRTLVTRGRTSFYTPISIYPKRILSHLNYSTTNPQGENTNNKIADNTYTAQNITQETDKNTEQESRDTENANTENSHEKDSNAEQKQQQRKRTTLMDRVSLLGVHI
jgi:cell shape-determining protein MreC